MQRPLPAVPRASACSCGLRVRAMPPVPAPEPQHRGGVMSASNGLLCWWCSARRPNRRCCECERRGYYSMCCRPRFARRASECARRSAMRSTSGVSSDVAILARGTRVGRRAAASQISACAPHPDDARCSRPPGGRHVVTRAPGVPARRAPRSIGNWTGDASGPDRQPRVRKARRATASRVAAATTAKRPRTARGPWRRCGGAAHRAAGACDRVGRAGRGRGDGSRLRVGRRRHHQRGRRRAEGHGRGARHRARGIGERARARDARAARRRTCAARGGDRTGSHRGRRRHRRAPVPERRGSGVRRARRARVQRRAQGPARAPQLRAHHRSERCGGTWPSPAASSWETRSSTRGPC